MRDGWRSMTLRFVPWTSCAPFSTLRVPYLFLSFYLLEYSFVFINWFSHIFIKFVIEFKFVWTSQFIVNHKSFALLFNLVGAHDNSHILFTIIHVLGIDLTLSFLSFLVAFCQWRTLLPCLDCSPHVTCGCLSEWLNTLPRCTDPLLYCTHWLFKHMPCCRPVVFYLFGLTVFIFLICCRCHLVFFCLFLFYFFLLFLSFSLTLFLTFSFSLFFFFSFLSFSIFFYYYFVSD